MNKSKVLIVFLIIIGIFAACIASDRITSAIKTYKEQKMTEETAGDQKNETTEDEAPVPVDPSKILYKNDGKKETLDGIHNQNAE